MILMKAGSNGLVPVYRYRRVPIAYNFGWSKLY